jgi:hypothetical protein
MRKNIDVILVLISLITIVSGLVQLFSPSTVLALIDADINNYTKHFFAIIGMFMFLFGGMLIHAIYSVNKNTAAVLWSSFQKLGAALAIGIGVLQGVFNDLAIAVALFDLLSGIVIFYYYKSIIKKR